MHWGCSGKHIYGYPFANYVGYMDLTSTTAEVKFSTGISSIKIENNPNS